MRLGGLLAGVDGVEQLIERAVTAPISSSCTTGARTDRSPRAAQVIAAFSMAIGRNTRNAITPIPASVTAKTMAMLQRTSSTPSAPVGIGAFGVEVDDRRSARVVRIEQ